VNRLLTVRAPDIYGRVVVDTAALGY
jgi:hypothetical protein